MIKYFQGHSRERYSTLTERMFRLRAEVFSGRLNWDISVQSGQEFDQLDKEADPLYVLSLCPFTGNLLGSFRFLPTTGPTLLKCALNRLFTNPVDIESPTIWECTRFVVCPRAPRMLATGGVCPVTAELMMAACHLSLEAGVTQIMAVFERPMLKIYRRAGWAPEIVDTSSGGVSVGLWNVSEHALMRMRTLNDVELVIDCA